MQFDDWYGRQNPDHIDELSARFAWEALMAEIRPLVADLRTNVEIGQHFLSNKPWLNEAQADAKAVERLRELVREK